MGDAEGGSEEGADVVQLEIDSDKLRQLFDSGLLCAADVRCLNPRSKRRIWQLCLASCASSMRNCTSCDYFKRCGRPSMVASNLAKNRVVTVSR